MGNAFQQWLVETMANGGNPAKHRGVGERNKRPRVNQRPPKGVSGGGLDIFAGPDGPRGAAPHRTGTPATDAGMGAMAGNGTIIDAVDLLQAAVNGFQRGQPAGPLAGATRAPASVIDSIPNPLGRIADNATRVKKGRTNDRPKG